jgi:hypothetical protein
LAWAHKQRLSQIAALGAAAAPTGSQSSKMPNFFQNPRRFRHSKLHDLNDLAVPSAIAGTSENMSMPNILQQPLPALAVRRKTV